MQQISGTFVGTGAILNIGLGFKPDWVKITNLTSATIEGIEWNKRMALAAVAGGLKTVRGADADITKLAHGAGISIYEGGVALSADSTSVLVADPAPDKLSAGTMGKITKWTLGSSANRTGNLDVGANTTYVGAGSKLTVLDAKGQPKEANIEAMTNDGDAANEVTLSEALLTGTVVGLTGMYDFVGAKAGTVTPAGVALAADADVNVAGEVCLIEAGTWE